MSNESNVCPECGNPSLKYFIKKELWRCINDECGEEFSAPINALNEGIIRTSKFSKQLSTFPSIIALPLQEYRSEGNPVLKLWHACDVVELLLRLTVTVGIAELIRTHGEVPAEMLVELRPRIEEPTLGKWKGMAIALSTHLRKGAPVVPEFPLFIFETITPFLDGRDVRSTVETAFSAVRNQLAHGGGVTRKAAERLLTLWQPRFEGLLQQCQWLNDLKLVIKNDRGGYGALTGVLRSPAAFSPSSPELEQQLAGAFTRGDEVVLVRGELILPLWPLTFYGVPQSPDPEGVQAIQSVPQIYVRRGEVRMQHTPVGSDEVCQSEADETALDAFLEFFRLRERDAEQKAKRYEIRGFDNEIRKDAERLVGRSEEIEAVLQSLHATRDGVFWLTGPAGIGKSYLVARVATKLLDHPPQQTLVLPYRFKAGDDRCGRESFIRFVNERLRDWSELEQEEEESSFNKPIEELKALLARVNPSRLLLILDGLDELAEHDATFAAEIPLALAFPGLVWMCAGRQERGLPELFSAERCISLFPKGLPPMNTGDIRTMLLEKIGPLRKRLLANDQEDGTAVINPFIDKVAAHAQGLPIYITYVIGDILSNRYRALDVGERLPLSLDKYHEELLKRCAVGVLHQVLTPLAALLAVAKEPLGADALAELLVRANVLTAEDKPLALVKRGLSAIASMLRRATTPEGNEGYTLFHHSLRQHMEQSAEMRVPLTTRRRDLCRMAMSPGTPGNPEAPYLCRWGVTHLCEENRTDEALQLLTGFGYLMNRLQVLPGPTGVRGVREDWRQVARGDKLDGDPAIWEKFWRTHQHILVSGDDNWPTYKILRQLGWDHADNSPITKAVEAWVDQEDDNWLWMHLDAACRDPELLEDPCMFVLMGHQDGVNAVDMSADGHLAISAGGRFAEDYTVRLWNLHSQFCVHAFQGHKSNVKAISLTADGRKAVSGDDLGAIRVWDLLERRCLGELFHEGGVEAIAIQGNGKLAISAGRQGNLVLWDISSMALLKVITTGLSEILALTCDHDWGNVFATGTGGTIKCCPLLGELPIFELADAPGRALCLALSPDGEWLLAGGDDGQLVKWSIYEKGGRSLLAQYEEPIATLSVTPDSRHVLLCFGGKNDEAFASVADCSIRIIDFSNGQMVSNFWGHSDDIMSLRISQDGKRAISGSRDFNLRVWDLSLVGKHLKSNAEAICVYSMSASSNREKSLLCTEKYLPRILNLSDLKFNQWDIGHTAAVFAGDIHPNGNTACTIASEYEDAICFLWSTQDGKVKASVPAPRAGMGSVVWSPDGAWLGFTTFDEEGLENKRNGHRIWHLAKGHVARFPHPAGKEIWVPKLVVSPDSRFVITPEKSDRMGLWSDEGSTPISLSTESSNSLIGLNVSPDGRSCFYGDMDGCLYLWDLRSQEVVILSKGKKGDYLRNMAITADNQFLYVCTDDSGVQLWDISSQKCIAKAHHGAWPMALAIYGASHDAVVGFSDGYVKKLHVVNGPEPLPPIVTAVRLWRPNLDTDDSLASQISGIWDTAITAPCPWCATRFEPDSIVLDIIRSIVRPLGENDSPCLTLPDETWDEPQLLSECTLCHKPVKFNPFLVDNRERFAG